MVDRPECVYLDVQIHCSLYLKNLPNQHRNQKRIKTQVYMAEAVLSPGRAINTGDELQTHDCKLSINLSFN